MTAAPAPADAGPGWDADAPADRPPGTEGLVRPAPDLRLPALGAAAWLGAIAGTVGRSGGVLLVLLLGGLGVALVVRRRRRRRWLLSALAAALVSVTAAGVADVRLVQVDRSPVAVLAADRAVVTAVGTVRSDPAAIAGAFGDELVWRFEARTVVGRGRSHRLAAPVLVISPADQGRPPLGATVRLTGRLAPADGQDLAAVLLPSRPATVVTPPGPWWRAAAAVRTALRESVADRPADQRAMVPAMVDGDDAGLAADLQDDFRATGLTHLLAVSGTNLTLMVGFLLLVARWVGVRGRWLLLVGAAGVAGFVMLARTEPSVLRAAVMGTVGLLAMGSNGRHRALRGLGLAVLVLVLVDPGLAVSAGFALSALATAGILLLAPGWRDALARWLPRWTAEAIAVPAAAQLACTPVVAALSGQVSLVAVAANLLAAPAVGPATVLGLLGGLTTLVWPALGRLLGTLASWCVAWLVTIAVHGAALPSATLGWGTGAAALALLTGLCLVTAVLAPRVLRRPVTGVPALAVLLLVVLLRPPSLGWPPTGWVLVACDVGQGDGLVLNAGGGAAVVVDAGPDPRAIDRCLDRLGVRTVPLLLLTHIHAPSHNITLGPEPGSVAGVAKAKEVPKTAGIYCRISRDAEGEEVGVARQEKDCRELAERLGLVVVGVFTDNDTGASDFTRKGKTRPQYEALLDEVRAGRVGHILSYSNSRLTRRLKELEVLVELSKETGVRIRTVVSGGDVDLSTADGLTVARILASVDAGEAHRISERMKVALLYKAQSGEPKVTSNRPFGWLPDGRTLDPVESELIRRGVHDLAGGMPLNHIRRRWEAEGVETPAGATRWHWTNTLSVLTSWRTVGVATYKGEVLLDGEGSPIRGNWEPIVAMEDRAAALTQVEGRKLSRKRSGRYLLSGLLRCGECSMPMWGSMASGKGRSDAYLCSGGSGHVSIDADKLQNYVLLELYARLLNRALYGEAAFIEGPEGNAARKAARDKVEQDDGESPLEWAGEDELASVVGKLSTLMGAFTSGALSWETVGPQVTALEPQRDRLRREQATHEASQARPRREVIATGEGMSNWFKEVDSRSWEEKQALLRQETEAIVISKGVRGVASRDPEVFAARVRIAWRS